MNKNAIKKFAIEARQKLIASVTDKAGMLGITAEGVSAPTTKGNDFEVYQTAAGTEVTLNKKQCEQRRRLVEQIETKGFEEVVEEVAYTWFNRICAIRFMEVNDYLPSRVRALSSEKEGKNEPDLVTLALDVDLDLTDAEKEFVIESKMSGNLDELFAMLFVKQCNKLHEVLPELFEETSDYTELLLNISFTDKESIVQMLVNSDTGIPEDDFNVQKSGQVEIIGWLYQYYNEERKNEVINIYKGTVKKEDIPAATQLFTTDWVVRYMVDNSLGRYWIERNPDSKLREKLEFFVMPKNGDIEYIDEKIDPTELTFLDPCMGSGHILVYAFDVFMEIYRECGYSDRDAALNIVQNNLFGLDIDDRAYQLAYFAVMMKARSYNRRILSQDIHINLCALQETNGITNFECEGITKDNIQNNVGNYLIQVYQDAKEIGSLQTIEKYDYDSFGMYLDNLEVIGQMNIEQSRWVQNVKPLVSNLIKQAKIMSKRYCVVATNPPYMGKMQGKLKKFVVDNYKDYSGDLFAVFMYRNFLYCNINGYSAFMTPFVWMYLKTYKKLREVLIFSKSITTLVQMEYSAYEEATVPICTFVLKNFNNSEKGIYIKLSEFKGGMEEQKKKVLEAIDSNMCSYWYERNLKSLEPIPSLSIAYWASDKLIEAYEKGKLLGELANPCQGLATTNNDRFLRLWYEVASNNINFYCESEEDTVGDIKWFPINKGGEYRKWYGNNEYVVNYKNKGKELCDYIDETSKVNHTGRVINRHRYFRENGTWSAITSGSLSVRYSPKGYIISNAGMAIYSDDILYYVIALLNSKITTEKLIKMVNESINFNAGDIVGIPTIIDLNIKETVDELTKELIHLEKDDWDSHETSWDFMEHPLIPENLGENIYLINLYDKWEKKSKNRFDKIKHDEEKLNQLFNDLYGVDEISPEVEDSEITVDLADFERDVKSLLSYAVGCMFGRYSLDCKGLIFAGGEWDNTRYIQYKPDTDNIIPITDEEYFDDDIVGRLCEWLKVVYGNKTLEENLNFIAKALGNRGNSSRDIIRNYFLKDFIVDHQKMYQKRPIYWLFDSGKENGFKALIYMHRYSADTVGIVRTDYLHKTQKAIEQAMQRAEYTSENASSALDKKKAVQLITKYTKQLAQMKTYDEAMAHIANQRIEIDLDDGVKVNYEKFQGVEVAQEGKKALKIDLLAKIK